jgi:hypothetical protein
MSVKELRKIYQLKISLVGAKPPIWRRVLVSNGITFEGLHNVIQISMGWTNSHLHQFLCGDTVYGIIDDDLDFGMDVEDENKHKITKALVNEKDSIVYEYDFGDDWQHKVLLEKVLPFKLGAQYPVCIKGKRECPPEDCGGIWGYHDLVDILQDSDNPEYEEMLEWVGGELDPDEFDLDETNLMLIEYCS